METLAETAELEASIAQLTQQITELTMTDSSVETAQKTKDFEHKSSK